MSDDFDDYEDDKLCGDIGYEQGEIRECTKGRRHKDNHYSRVHDFSWPLDEMDQAFVGFLEAMERTTQDLKMMREFQDKMRWQLGWPQEYCDFRSELEKALKGWVSSNC